MTWQILPDPLTPDVVAPSGLYTEVPDTGRGPSVALFGRGVLFPLRRAKSVDDFASGSGADLIRAGVALILSTVCSSKTSSGELPWRTEFGSLLQLLRNRNNDAALQGLARHYVAEALQRWLPVVQVRQVKFSKTNPYTLRMLVLYDVVDPQGVRVLVPGLQTAVPLG